MAAYDLTGFIQWRIYEESCSSAHVADFLALLPELCKLETHLLFDNASNQRSHMVIDFLEDKYPHHYHFIPPYSPPLKPIERVFYNVKRYIRCRKNSTQGQYDPIGLIMEAFQFYNYQGEGSDSGM